MSEQANRSGGTLGDWIDAVRIALDIERDLDQAQILDLARQVAHNVARPATPITTYLLGLAVAAGADPDEAVGTLTELARGWGGGDPAARAETEI